MIPRGDWVGTVNHLGERKGATEGGEGECAEKTPCDGQNQGIGQSFGQILGIWKYFFFKIP